MSAFALAPLAADVHEPALALRGLNKSFVSGKKESQVVTELNLDIPRGTLYGLVGPNGAGKTTTILLATGLLRPDSGSAYVCGHNVWGGDMLAAKRSYGLLADGLPVFNRLTAAEYLSYLGRIRGLDPQVIASRSADLLEALALQDSAHKQIADFSAGMTKKILLAGALLHRPEILILDEPLEAVDPVSAQIVRQLLGAYVAGGGTVIMSSHVMELVEGLCDHVAVIAGGTVVTSGTVAQVRGDRTLAEVFVEIAGGGSLAAEQLSWLRGAEQ